MIPSKGACEIRMYSAAAATEPRSERSQATGIHAAPACAQAALALVIELARPMTAAPLASRARIVWNPLSEMQSVTTNLLAERSMPAMTWSAVERALKALNHS